MASWLKGLKQNNNLLFWGGKMTNVIFKYSPFKKNIHKEFYQHRLWGFLCLFLKCRQWAKMRKCTFFFFLPLCRCVCSIGEGVNVTAPGSMATMEPAPVWCASRTGVHMSLLIPLIIHSHQPNITLWTWVTGGVCMSMCVCVCVCLGTCIFAEWYQSHVLLMTLCTLQTEDDNQQFLLHSPSNLANFLLLLIQLFKRLFVYLHFYVCFLWWLSIKILIFKKILSPDQDLCVVQNINTFCLQTHKQQMAKAWALICSFKYF